MNVKKKLIGGALSAVMGLSLVGGGTYAAFNDIEQVSNEVKTGMLDLSVDQSILFNVKDLKPGDSIKRKLRIINSGTLDISGIRMGTTYVVKNKSGIDVTNTDLGNEFASQHSISIETAVLVRNYTIEELRGYLIDVSRFYPEMFGLRVGDESFIEMTVKFEDIPDRVQGGRDFVQNKFQGFTLEVKFELTAPQTSGESK